MLIDFSAVENKTTRMLEFAQHMTVHDLRAAVNAYIDATLDIIGTASDAQLTHLPHDPEAYDPFAPEADQHIGWSLAHLVLHVTASLEETAAFGSLLARGVVIPAGVRLRYEPDWRSVTSRVQVIQRLEECRRMTLAYLDTWPVPPHLDVFRDLTERQLEHYGPLNAPAAFLNGLRHWQNHMDQFHEVARQAREAIRA